MVSFVNLCFLNFFVYVQVINLLASTCCNPNLPSLSIIPATPSSAIVTFINLSCHLHSHLNRQPKQPWIQHWSLAQHMLQGLQCETWASTTNLYFLPSNQFFHCSDFAEKIWVIVKFTLYELVVYIYFWQRRINVFLDIQYGSYLLILAEERGSNKLGENGPW